MKPRPTLRCQRQHLLGASILMVVALLALPGHANGQCWSTASRTDMSVPGSVRFSAVTTQQNCNGTRTAVVRSWIDGLEFTCWVGAPVSGYCFAQDSEGNAGTFLGAQVWGLWNGRSHHWYLDPGSVDLGTFTTLLYSGSPEAYEECPGQWIWNPNTGTCEPPPNCPIVVAVGRDSAYKLTSAEDGVWFDIDGDGTVERIAWTERDSPVAFLAIDRDGDGQITSGRELFGNHMLSGAKNGFMALASMALEAGAGVIRGSLSVDDAIFSRLLLWTDVNHNGVSEPSELGPAGDRLAEIGLGYQDHQRKDGHGNHFAFRGWVSVRTQPGRNAAADPGESKERRRYIYDVVLAMLR